ncbi:MAG: bifunctional folylpolyglutamate synthase/dihydrofolate synthase [Candidatus Eisenbacteria bacterium]|uniref:tetrahydrofolate synthase n=1 Tax=Eiseniibacteriota bacterium TaxID=2212470 RepID=A0A538U3Z3_UNCEI|nr:MAG: bifunctional folylpolyglutamate synthase/dihydrofolate synthase [Candidatus Eisenbacteria bacterium]
MPARRVRDGKGIHRPHRAPQADARRGRPPARVCLALDPRIRSRWGNVAARLPPTAPLGRHDRSRNRNQVTIRLQRRLETLFGLERRKDKLGLDGTLALLAALGDPHRRFRSILVAGTNGKGSVCAMVERVLRQAGRRTGLYTSPHLVDFRERIRVDGRWVDDGWLEGTLDRIEALPEGRDRTFFEVATALAFLWFAEREVQIAVVEVGLGGRLDCTNVLSPDLCVIASIGLDHTDILGDTLEKIATEKAGIVKPGTPVICAAQPAALPTIEAIARELRAPVLRAVACRARHARWGSFEARCPLRGRHQLENLHLALATLAAWARGDSAIDRAAVQEGLARTRWPGRLEPCPADPRLWWDGAHNPDGVRSLLASWIEDLGFDPPRAIALALSRDKDLSHTCAAIAERVPDALLIATRAGSVRALAPEEIQATAAARGLRVETIHDLPAAVRRALEVAGSGRALLTGSLFAVGEAMETFGGAPGEWT